MLFASPFIDAKKKAAEQIFLPFSAQQEFD
jgi:hypothetical protein